MIYLYSNSDVLLFSGWILAPDIPFIILIDELLTRHFDELGKEAGNEDKNYYGACDEDILQFSLFSDANSELFKGFWLLSLWWAFFFEGPISLSAW